MELDLLSQSHSKPRRLRFDRSYLLFSCGLYMPDKSVLSSMVVHLMNLNSSWGPQGSILGPTLFILHTSDHDQCFTLDTNLGTFAGGITLYNLVQSTTEKDRSTKSLQEALENRPRCGTKSKVKFEPASPKGWQYPTTRSPSEAPISV